MIICLVLGLIVAYGGAKYWRTTFKPSTSLAETQKEQTRLKPILSVVDTVFFDVAALKNGKIFATCFNHGESKELYVSNDGGKSWNIVMLPKGVMHRMTFLDDTNGWVVGSGYVLHTKDDGQTWEQISKPTNYDLSEITFVNSKVGYVGGGAERGCQIFRTSDGGKTWSKVYENFEEGIIFDLVALDEKTAIAAINDSFLLRTEDSGKTWQTIKLKTQGASGLTVTSEGNVWVVGRNGSFYYSTDSGRTLQRPSNLSQNIMAQNWDSIAFVDAKRGVAVGNNGAMMVTQDGGMTWKEIETGVTDNLGNVRLNGESAIVIGSQKLYKATSLFETFHIQKNKGVGY